MTSDEQVRLWLEGKSVHEGSPGKGECCPDFSCCRPEFQASREDRERFAKAYFAGDEDAKMEMLMGFLARAMDLEFGDRVHVAGRGGAANE